MRFNEVMRWKMKRQKRNILLSLFILILVGFCFFFLKKLFINEKVYILEEKPNIIEDEAPKEDPFLIALRKEKYFIEGNMERYKSYANEKEMPISKIISDVNVNLDKEMYKDIEQTDISVNNLMLVNKFFYLTEEYEPNDLVTLSSKYNSGVNSKMRKEAAEHFMEMSDAALLDNIIIKNASGYRSYAYQVNLYNKYVKRDGIEAADKYSARPGHSEHQTGLTSDINIINDSFEKTPAFHWLKENAYKYGFILRFPKDKEYITGYKYEPWHYRYVGVEEATQIQKESLTLEEYYAFYIQK